MAGSGRRRPSWRWRDWPLRWKGLGVVSLPVVALVTFSVLGLMAQGTHDRLDQAEQHASRLRATASTTLIAVLDIETAARDYLLTGDGDSLAEFQRVADPERLSVLVTRLGRLLEQDPEQQRGATRIESLVAERVSIATFTVASGPDNVTQGILARSRLVMGELRREIEDILAEEEADVLLLREELESQERRTAAIQVAGLVLGLLGGLAGALMFASGVVRRVRRLEANAALLAAGKLPAALLPGEDEIGRLGRALEDSAMQLGNAKGLLQGVIEGTSDVVFVKDLSGRYLLMNEAGRSYLGQPLDEIIGRTDEGLYEPGLAASIRQADRKVILSGKTSVHETTDTIDGRVRTFLTTKGPYRDGSGRVAGLFGIARDITDRQEAERAISEMNEKLRQQAIIDELTGLHNRRAFMAIGEHEIRSAIRTEQPLAVLFTDLDGMKAINDSFGHAEGDRALRDAADILGTTLRSTDVVARLGGDEFCALLPNCPPEQVAAVLGRIDEAIQLHRGTRPFVLSLSLGVAVHEPGTPESLEDLIRRADAAMYEQKAGRNVGA